MSNSGWFQVRVAHSATVWLHTTEGDRLCVRTHRIKINLKFISQKTAFNNLYNLSKSHKKKKPQFDLLTAESEIRSVFCWKRGTGQTLLKLMSGRRWQNSSETTTCFLFFDFYIGHNNKCYDSL